MGQNTWGYLHESLWNQPATRLTVLEGQKMETYGHVIEVIPEIYINPFAHNKQYFLLETFLTSDKIRDWKHFVQVGAL